MERSREDGRADPSKPPEVIAFSRKRLLYAHARNRLHSEYAALCDEHLLLNGAVLSQEAAPDLRSFAQLHSLIKPASSEQKWIEIPWMTSLWEARQRAAAEGKPILLWEMDGHPLGCT